MGIADLNNIGSGLSFRLANIISSAAEAGDVYSALNTNTVADLYFYAKTLISAPVYSLTDNAQPTPDYTTLESTTLSFSDQAKSTLGENVSDSRYMRFMNPVFKYDFKVGNYMPDSAKKMNPHLFMTIKDVTTGIRKSSWFTSADYARLLKSNIASHALYFSDNAFSNPSASTLTGLNADLDSTFSANDYHSTNVTFTGGFYNVFNLLSSSSTVLNSR